MWLSNDILFAVIQQEEIIVEQTLTREQTLEQKVSQLCKYAQDETEAKLSLGSLYKQLLELEFTYAEIKELAERQHKTELPTHMTLLKYYKTYHFYCEDLNLPLDIVSQQGIGKLMTIAKHDGKLGVVFNEKNEAVVTENNREGLAGHAIQQFQRDISEFKQALHIKDFKSIKIEQGVYDQVNQARERLGKLTGDGISHNTWTQFMAQVGNELSDDQILGLWQQATGEETIDNE